MNSFTNIKNTTTSYYVLLVFIIFLYLLYFLIVPRIETKNAIQGGNVLVNNPIYLNVSTNIGSYQSLNGENDLSGQYQYDYNYAISCWVFINANTGKSTFNTYSSILDYGGKPTISYNASDNTMRITMQSDPEFAYEHTGTDASHNNVVYTQTDVLLQKWNNIIINYNGGTLDIFYNGKLVKSVIEVVPQMALDSLIVGDTNGVQGGICNINYFKTNLNMTQIYYLYNSVKDKTPPVAIFSNDTLIKSNNATPFVPPVPKTLVIPINIDIIEPSGSVIESGNNFAQVINPSTNIGADYLSMKWFFDQKQDIYNGLN